jgi:hypothetical protein
MRKRSKYRPRPVLVNPLGYVLESMTPISQHDSFLVDLKIKNHLAMAALTHGRATKQDMDLLINMNNVTHALLRMGFGTEFKQYMDAGRNALYEVCSRGAETKTKFVCRGPEITALNALLELHDAQLDAITVRDMEKAVALVEHEQKTGKMIPIQPKEKANATNQKSS